MQQEIGDLILKQDIVSQALNTKNENQNIEHFREDIKKFADGLTTGSKAIIKLQDIGMQLQIIVTYPELYQRSIVAVGGDFSTGKSSFINSFMRDKEFELATKRRPTIAIPTTC